MKFSPEIYTSKLEESKEFYTRNLGFEIVKELEGYIVLSHPKYPEYEIQFCIPNSPFVKPIFHPEFRGPGLLFQFEVEDVEIEWRKFSDQKGEIVLELCSEPVNGKHFTLMDPNGILIDLVEFEK
ncbi:VOC family protein [Leptospira sarikeiensis]|uniref:Glyoxalase n=1 Tax=Leptospira sarikeiensis TaxID=2484943 RepID=A0A4R9KCT4_9LEPT|nr:VOC family protein [Leptospira sarikeiensis]TGL64873.1 glyoxalase [Leptospira sarikeiensis]